MLYSLQPLAGIVGRRFVNALKIYIIRRRYVKNEPSTTDSYRKRNPAFATALTYINIYGLRDLHKKTLCNPNQIILK